MKNNNRELDKFYTKLEIAEKCLENYINVLEKDNINYKSSVFLEPSAGNGSFLKALESENLNYVAGDIEPDNNNFNIQKINFIEENVDTGTIGNILVIGNPPFGKRSKLAIEFIKKSLEYSDYVGFILPIQFLKYLTQKQLPENLKLIYSEILEPEAFTINDKNVSIRCVFQVWTKNENTNFEDLRILVAPPTKHLDFETFTYNCTKGTLWMFDIDWDFAVLRQGWDKFEPILYKDKDTLNKKKQYMFFKAKNKKTLNNLLNIDFNKLGELNTSVKGFGKADLITEYNNLYENS